MLKNINISHKITLMIVLPIVGLIYFTTTITLNKRETVNQMNLLQELSVLAVKSSALIHELQKERGLSAGFIGSQAVNFSKELQAQRLSTDIAMKEFESFLKNCNVNNLSHTIQDNLNRIFAALKVIETKRNLLNKLNLSIEEELQYYNQLIDSLLMGINYLSKGITNAELYNKVLAYVNLLQAKEQAGIERATLNNVFSRGEGHFTPGMYNKFILLVGLQDTYIKNFFFFATAKQKSIFQETMQNPYVDDVEKMREIAIDKQLKLKLTADLQIHLGYGGLIHHFKNYILRGNQKYIDAFRQQYQEAYTVLGIYKELPDISSSDIKNIKIVKNTFDRYNQHLTIAIKLKSQKKTVDEIDAIVKIDDVPAIKALDELLHNSHLHLAPMVWWKMATGRINLFKMVEDQIAADLKTSAEKLKKNAHSVFIFSLIITGCTILFTLFLSIFLAHGITKPLKVLVNAANKISSGNRENVDTGPKNGDCGTLSRAMNQMLFSIRDSEAALKKTNEEVIQRNELIHKIFGRYLSSEIVEMLLETKSGLALGGERREITILTSDIRGFTAHSNQLPPEQVVEIINFYLTAMTEVITEYQGTIDEFMGDGILVLFGAPIAREDDPERAVACAVAMQLAMNQVNEQMIAWGFEPLYMGIAVNTGEVVVGNLGSEKRTKYGVIGNEVNLTYRIESYTTGGQIFISEPTLIKVDEIIKIRSEKQVLPKGIKNTINIYEVDGIDGKYNLHLHKKEEELFLPLKEEIPLQYAILEGKHVGEQKFQACLLKLSATGALICCDVEKDLLPAPLDNLKIHLVLPNASENSENSDDIYAKVLSRGADEKSLYLHFTHMPIHVKACLVALYKIEWTPEMSINHPLLDKQHQQIFSRLNELNVVAYHIQEKEVAEIINFLEHHAMTHFKDEEQVMKQYDFPYYTIHQAQHLTYIEKFDDFRQKYQQKKGNNLHLVLQIQKEMVDWLIRHIGESDKQLGLFLKEKIKV